jgi:hypothetical protein
MKIADRAIMTCIDNQPSAIGDQQRRGMVAGDIVRAKTDCDQVDHVEGRFPKATWSWRPNLRRVIDQDVEPAMFSADPGEQVGDRNIVTMIDGSGDPGAAGARDEFGGFADGAAKRRVTIGHASPGDIDGSASLAECDRYAFSRASAGACDNSNHASSPFRRPIGRAAPLLGQSCKFAWPSNSGRLNP